MKMCGEVCPSFRNIQNSSRSDSDPGAKLLTGQLAYMCLFGPCGLEKSLVVEESVVILMSFCMRALFHIDISSLLKTFLKNVISTLSCFQQLY